jgi:hypothetical protein
MSIGNGFVHSVSILQFFLPDRKDAHVLNDFKCAVYFYGKAKMEISEFGFTI